MSEYDFSEDDAFLKKIGRKPPSAPAAAPTTTAEPGKSPEKPPSFLQERAAKARGQAYEGLKLGTADVVTGMGSLAGNLFPPLRTLAKAYAPEFAQKAYSQLEEDAARPSQNWQQRQIRFGVNLLPYSKLAKVAGPVSGAVTSGLSRAIPALGPKFVATATGPVFQRGAASTIGNLTGTAAAGAAGGAYTDPEHPYRGAAVGAASAPVPGAVGDFLRGKYGKSIGAHMIAGGATFAVIHAFHNGMGVPYEIIASAAIPGLRWHSTPSGSIVRRVGNQILDESGKVVGSINPALAGGATAKTGEATGATAGIGSALSHAGSWIMNRLRSDPE